MDDSGFPHRVSSDLAFKTLILHVRPSPGGAAAVTSAVKFAQTHGARLVGVGARAPAYVNDAWVIDPSVYQALADDETAALEEAECIFQRHTAGMSGRASWRTRRDFPNNAVIYEAAGADLILCGIEPGMPAHAVNIGGLVIEAGLPVLTLPANGAEVSARTILVCWRNTREARRALSSALPFLKAADAVRLVQIASDDDAPEAWDGLHAAVARLAEHGVTAEAAVRKPAKDAASLLLDEAGALGADMIVLGAYGHSRAREWILGGVTRDLLEWSNLPLLLAH